MNNVNGSSLSLSLSGSLLVLISASRVSDRQLPVMYPLPVHSQLRSINTSTFSTSKFRMEKCYYGCFLVLRWRKWRSCSVFLLLFKFLLLRDATHNICIKYTIQNKGAIEEPFRQNDYSTSSWSTFIWTYLSVYDIYHFYSISDIYFLIRKNTDQNVLHDRNRSIYLF